LKQIYLLISKQFILYFLILFFALETFFITIDFILNSEKIPSSANLYIIYLINSFFYSISLISPISLILAYITLWVRLLKRNELVALYSIGHSKQRVVRPIFLISLLLSIIFMLFNFSSFAYSRDNMKNILENRYFTDLKSDIFVKSSDNYIFIEEMYRVEKKLENITVFEYKDGTLQRVLKSKMAKYIDGKWIVKDATIYIPPKNMSVDLNSKLEIKVASEMSILKGFKPKILDNISEQKISLSIIDAINTISLLNQENLSTDKVRGILYSMTVFPMFAPFFIVILFFYSSASNRLTNSIKLSSIFIFSSLSVWGLLYALTKFSMSNTIIPEVGIVLPVLIIASISIYFYNRI
jgi:lipopolysaccharide export system permease protein